MAGAIWWVASQTGSGNPTGKAISRLSTGDFHSLAFSPNDPDTVYFGHHNGLMISRNGGRTWGPAPLQNADAMALGIAPANPQIMYAAGHDVFVKSTDGGQTWSRVAHNLPGTDIHGFAVDADDAEKVYAHVVGQAGLFVSDDGGLTWRPIPAALPAMTFNLGVGENSQTLYAAAGQAGVWRSIDGGQNWSQLTNAPGGAVALAYNRSNKILLITTLGDEAGLYASDDSGGSWKSLELKGMLMAVASSPTDPNRIIAVDENGWVYASQDGGLRWPDK
ncbi:MAG TPA: YCF48-related protein [Anaerolineales bacterium]|nr:YCF48-related protein [Anaerolineales bacterium]